MPDTDAAARVPRPIRAGTEMAALARFHRDMSWSGTIEAGGMGPGTPAMTARGSGTHSVIQDGLWIVGDYGRAGVMRGRIAGDRLTFESAVDEPVRIRLTWDLAAADRIVWRNEMSVNGGPWSLVEQYDCVPSATNDERTDL